MKLLIALVLLFQLSSTTFSQDSLRLATRFRGDVRADEVLRKVVDFQSFRQGVDAPLVLNGRPTDQFPEVVYLTGSSGVCSGNLITETVILTAKHCYCRGSTNEASFGADAHSSNARKIRVETARAKIMGSCNRIRGTDLALLPIEHSFGTRPRPIGDTGGLLSQSVAHIVGYGQTMADKERFGRATEGHVAIVSHRCNRSGASDPSTYGCEENAELVASAIRDKPDSMPHDTCPGDSGGPIHVEYRPKEFHLIGLTSRPIRESGVVCGDGGIYVLLDGERRRWIEENLKDLH